MSVINAIDAINAAKSQQKEPAIQDTLVASTTGTVIIALYVCLMVMFDSALLFGFIYGVYKCFA